MIRVHVRHGNGAAVTHELPYGSTVSRVAKPGYRYILELRGVPAIFLPLSQKLLDDDVHLVGVPRKTKS